MYGGEPIEIVITPATTYILLNRVEHGRRIYTDGRDWPDDIESVSHLRWTKCATSDFPLTEVWFPNAGK